MNENEVRLSDKARKMLEKQLQLLLEQNEQHTTGHAAMAILELVKVLEKEDRLRERDARWEGHLEAMRKGWEEELAKNRELEVEENQQNAHRHRHRELFFLGGFALLTLIGGILFWLSL